MKAVILAGGEGTRLRPLTSNQPKPMMPIANVPMMEHIVQLLAEHGFDDIVVTVAFLANHIRNYFGDGSEFGVRMRYATEESPLGTAGSVRNAMDELDETFLVISGDVLTDIDLGALVDAHREQQRVRVDRAEAGREPGRVRHRDHPATTARSSASSRSRRGARCSPTRSTPASTCSSPGCSSYIPEGEVVDFSSDVFPAMLDQRLQAATATSSTATGRTSARSSRTAPPTRTSSTVGSRSSSRASSCGSGCGSARAPTSRPTSIVEGPGAHRRQLAASRPARCCGPYTVLGADVVVKADAQRRAHASCTTTCYIGQSARLRGAVLGRASDIRDSVRIEEGVVDRRRVLRRRPARSSTRRVKIYPFKIGRAGRARHVVDRVGEQGRAHAVRPARCARARQRRHHLGGRGAARDGVRHRAQEGLGRLHQPRHQSRRPARSSGRSSPAST